VALYVAAVFFVGVGVYWDSQTPPSKLKLDLIFYGVPVVVAFSAAVLWELVRSVSNLFWRKMP
jgi:hypothetical protein